MYFNKTTSIIANFRKYRSYRSDQENWKLQHINKNQITKFQIPIALEPLEGTPLSRLEDAWQIDVLTTSHFTTGPVLFWAPFKMAAISVRGIWKPNRGQSWKSISKSIFTKASTVSVFPLKAALWSGVMWPNDGSQQISKNRAKYGKK